MRIFKTLTRQFKMVFLLLVALLAGGALNCLAGGEVTPHESGGGSTTTYTHKGGGKAHVVKDKNNKVSHVVLAGQNGIRKTYRMSSSGDSAKVSASQTGTFSREYDPKKSPENQEADKTATGYSIQGPENPHGSEGGGQVADMEFDKDLSKTVEAPQVFHDAIQSR